MEEIFSEHDLRPDPAALRLIPRRVAERLLVCPVTQTDGVLTILMAEPDNLLVLDQLGRMTGLKIQSLRGTPDVVRRCVLHFYSEEPTEIVPAGEAALEPAEEIEDAFATLVNEAPAVAVVNALLEQAINQRASDVHIEAHANRVLVRFRIDGVMYDQQSLPLEHHASIISRIKILAKMDIAEKRIPLDGRFDGKFHGQAFDVRVSTVPAYFGETAVLRILPKNTSLLRLRELGLASWQLNAMEDLIGRPYGMILATGPTGSGKTTTLCACLAKVDRASKNVITIEDPVEYQIPRVTQIQIHPKAGLTFAVGLRHILRQDPDVLMVGEIRDLETLVMAIQSSLTGHLVLSTLHCNDAASAPVRLVDMGAESFLVASSLAAVVAQRLVRRICPNCKAEVKPSREVLDRLPKSADDGSTYYRGRGCKECRGTGYRGMVAVFEVLVINEALRQAVVRKASASELRAIAKQSNLPDMQEDGIQKAREGITSLEEVVRAVYMEE